MDSSVLLSTEDLRIREGPGKPLELALLSGSMIVLLGDESTVAPELAGILAGRIAPASGTVRIGESETGTDDRRSRGRIEYVPSRPLFPEGMTVSEYLELAAAAASHSRKNTGDVITQLCRWCSLEDVKEEELNSLPEGTRYISAFAAACLPVPDIFVLQGPFPQELNPMLEDVCQGGCAVVARLPGVQYIPHAADRIALCDTRSVRRIIRFQELSDACSRLMRLNVKFFPALPRAVMESLPGARDIVSVQGGFEFRHSGLSAAVTNLVNMARANSRQIAGLEVKAPGNGELLDYFTEEEETGEADLFCEEDLDI